MISRTFRYCDQLLIRQTKANFSSKTLVFDKEARQQLLNGIDIVAKSVAVTLGPGGYLQFISRNVLIDQTFGSPKITKDGVTVAKALQFDKKNIKIGASLIKEVANKTHDQAGDGTTTATILAREIYKLGFKKMNVRANPIELKKGINLAVQAMVKELKNMSVPVKEKQMIKNVASIAANGDKEIGSLLAQLFEKVGQQGTISVKEGKTLNHEIEIVEGLKFDQGFVSPYFVTDHKTMKCVFDNPYILLLEKKVKSLDDILPYLEKAVNQKRPLIIIAQDFESNIITTLVYNKLKAGLQICCIKPPSFGDNRKNIMTDLQILTGGIYLAEQLGYKMNQPVLQALGSAKQVVITKDDTLITQGQGSKYLLITRQKIKQRVDSIIQQIKITNSSFEKEKMQERVAKLSGGVGIIKVGGASQVEVNEIKDRIQDALCATRAALSEGIVVGGGVALIYAARVLDNLNGENAQQNEGIDIIKNAIKKPAYIIIQNAGQAPYSILKQLTQSKDNKIGYDAVNMRFVNMFEAGIIDPTKVVRNALVDASSIAGMMMTTQCIVMQEQQKKKQ